MDFLSDADPAQTCRVISAPQLDRARYVQFRHFNIDSELDLDVEVTGVSNERTVLQLIMWEVDEHERQHRRAVRRAPARDHEEEDRQDTHRRNLATGRRLSKNNWNATTRWWVQAGPVLDNCIFSEFAAMAKSATSVSESRQSSSLKAERKLKRERK